LRAHVEASTEFSILLSGVILKFGVFGLYRVLSSFGGGSVGLVLAALSCVGMVESLFRLLSQRDLKRVVALTTVFELNWVAFCLSLGGGVLDHVALFLVVAHSFTTAAEFFIVDCISRRFGSRDLTAASGLFYATPHLFLFSLVTTLITVGFPGTSLFFAKVQFLSSLAGLAAPLFVIFSFILLLGLPLIFFRV